MNNTLLYGLALSGSLILAGCGDKPQTTESSADEVITLRMSHFMAQTDPFNKQVFEPWAKKIEEDSNGRLKIDIYPSASLSKPDNTYDAVVKGVVDIGVQPQGYSSGRFPLSQIAELPGIANTAEQLACVLHTLYDNGSISGEYEDTHVLYMMASGLQVFHTKGKAINKPSDLKGMRIRRTSTVSASLLESLGAVPVGLPVTETYPSLQRGVIDGVTLPWQPIQAFGLDELVDTHSIVPFYNAEFVVNMNQEKYNSLPDDLKQVIDSNSGMQMGVKASQAFDRFNQEVMQAAIDKGDTIIDIDPANDPDWQQPLEDGKQAYLSSLEEQGLDAQAIYAKAQQASTSCQS
ncbi:C4-dicarboxylate ABC transporter substrate-binding protein [Psychrobacter sp. FDAARGOS_221]|nr:C4-dicarboxylate ABC transporter substrate-binding protein [Psychrobacter sp. FDAARGOS_221]